MKIERISDTQIRCTLSSFDLGVRNMSLGELAYGSPKARELFREMLQAAAIQVGFEVGDMPLMVEAIPQSNESIVLLITRVEDPEEVDTRFARFSPSPDDETDISEPEVNILEGAQTVPEETNVSDDADKPVHLRAFSFDSIDSAALASSACGNAYTGQSVLYKTDSGKYILLLEGSDDESRVFSATCNILSEYSSRINVTYPSRAYYNEHFETIIAASAIEALAKL